MRYSLLIAVLLSIACVPLPGFAQTTGPRLAPVDEYFGQTNESVLEIRNRIAEVEAKPMADLRTPTTVSSLDYFEDALVDWQHKYPADPWVTDALSRTVSCYARAGAIGNSQAAELYSILTKAYSKSPAAERAVFSMWESPAIAAPAQTATQPRARP